MDLLNFDPSYLNPKSFTSKRAKLIAKSKSEWNYALRYGPTFLAKDSAVACTTVADNKQIEEKVEVSDLLSLLKIKEYLSHGLCFWSVNIGRVEFGSSIYLYIEYNDSHKEIVLMIPKEYKNDIEVNGKTSSLIIGGWEFRDNKGKEAIEKRYIETNTIQVLKDILCCLKSGFLFDKGYILKANKDNELLGVIKNMDLSKETIREIYLKMLQEERKLS